VHEDKRRPVARLENPDSNLRVCEAHAPARDLDATRFKQPTLGPLKRQRRLILYLGHRSVPFASLLVDEMIPDLDGLGVAHQISCSREPSAWRGTEDSQGRQGRIPWPARESKRASDRVLAARVLALGPKGNSAPLSRGYCKVAQAVAAQSLLHRTRGGRKEKLRAVIDACAGDLGVRESGRLHLVAAVLVLAVSGLPLGRLLVAQIDDRRDPLVVTKGRLAGSAWPIMRARSSASQ
jgi:hypothetical protein